MCVYVYGRCAHAVAVNSTATDDGRSTYYAFSIFFFSEIPQPSSIIFFLYDFFLYLYVYVVYYLRRTPVVDRLYCTRSRVFDYIVFSLVQAIRI